MLFCVEDGKLYVWGSEEHGGHHLYSKPERVVAFHYESLQHGGVKSVSCGATHTAVITGPILSAL